MKAVIYDRVSVKDVSSQEEHLNRCRAYAAAHGWEVVAEHVDTASGYKRDVVRLGWEQVRGLVERREVDAVIVFAVSRAGRNLAAFTAFLQLCRDNGVSFAAVTEDVSTAGQFGPVVYALIAGIAEMESAAKRERALLGRDVARRENRWTGGRRPYGWKPVKDNGGVVLVLDQEEASYIRRAAEVILNGGSLNAASAVMNDAGARTITGKPWAVASIGPLLSRDVNAPEIMSAGTLAKVQQAVAKRKPARGAKPRYLLTGLARCGNCDGKLKGKPVGGIPKYICTSTINPKTKKPTLHLSIVAREADEAVTRRLSSVVVDSTIVRDPGDAPEELQAALRETEEKLQNLGERWADGKVSDAAFGAADRKLRTRVDELEAQIAEASETINAAVYTEPQWESADEFYADPTTRAWVETLVEHVTVLPASQAQGRDRVRITLREGVTDA